MNRRSPKKTLRLEAQKNIRHCGVFGNDRRNRGRMVSIIWGRVEWGCTCTQIKRTVHSSPLDSSRASFCEVQIAPPQIAQVLLLPHPHCFAVPSARQPEPKCQSPPMSPSPPSPVIPKEAWAGCNVILDINGGDRVIFDRLTRRASVPSPDSRPQPFCPPN
jgi:hypothetical protein